jgi:hypothetical protein
MPYDDQPDNPPEDPTNGVQPYAELWAAARAGRQIRTFFAAPEKW